MKNLPTLLLTLLVLGGCATTYQSDGLTGGYKETVIGDFVEIQFGGNGYTSKEKANDFSLLRAAEFTLEKQYQYFIVEESKYYTVAALKPVSERKIKMLSNNNNDDSTYDAKYVLDSFEKKYGLKDKQFSSKAEEETFVDYLKQKRTENAFRVVMAQRKKNKEAIKRKQEQERIALEKRKQEEFNRLYNICLGFGFKEQNAISSCIQQEIFNEKKLLALQEQQIALEKQIALNSVQANRVEERGFLLRVLEGVTENLANPQTWEIARNKAEIAKLKREKAKIIIK